MTTIEKAVQWAISIANDSSHGYSQADRWGPDYDCSSFVISAYQQAGVPVKDKGATYTGNMRGAFLACGFVDVTTQVGLGTGYGLQAGDVLLNYSAHTCLYVGSGQVANARTSEGHPQSGDQGQEIRIQNYWNFPWNCVLRYKGEKHESGYTVKPNDNYTGSTTIPKEEETHDWKPPTLRINGSFSANCVVLQALLNVHGFNCGSADGFFGAKTQAAVTKAQRYYGLTVDGIVGPATWNKLLERG